MRQRITKGRSLLSLRLGDLEVEVHPQPQNGSESFVENRQSPRFRLQVDTRIYPRNTQVVRGHTVDISESGIAIMVTEEIPIGEVVRLEFTLPLGDVEILALVRQRCAFRYGFQFIETSSALETIKRTCRLLAVDQMVNPAKAHAANRK